MPNGFKRSLTNDEKFHRVFGPIYVNVKGEVLNIYSKQRYLVELIDGIPSVKLGGLSFGMHFARSSGPYTRVADLIAVVFKPTFVPMYLWKFISVYPIDENESNVHPSNLVWIFPVGGLEVPGTEGKYFFVPGFSQYGISIDREVMFLTEGTIKQASLIDGAYQVSAGQDVGHTTPSVGVYRLFALAFIPYPRNVRDLIINHKDGDRSNDALDNLEWITQKENIHHSIVRRAMGATPEKEFYKDNLPFSLETALEVGNPNIIKCLDVLTGEVKCHFVIARLRKAFDLLDNQIPQSLQAAGKGKLGLVKGRYIFRLLFDAFPNVDSEDVKNVLKRAGIKRAVLVKNSLTGNVMEFESATEAWSSLQLSKKVITTRLSRNTQSIPDTSYLVKYKDVEDRWIDEVG